MVFYGSLRDNKSPQASWPLLRFLADLIIIIWKRLIKNIITPIIKECASGAVVNVLDSELESFYYVHFKTKHLRKAWTPSFVQLWVK